MDYITERDRIASAIAALQQEGASAETAFREQTEAHQREQAARFAELQQLRGEQRLVERLEGELARGAAEAEGSPAEAAPE